jgi:RNA-binding protein NOB1
MSSVASPAQQLPLLIIDTNAFLKLFNLNELAQKYRIATSNGVLGEVRDKRAREQLDALAFGLQIVNSSENALKFTKKFALATGDLASLSAVDLDLLAVAYTLAETEGKV